MRFQHIAVWLACIIGSWAVVVAVLFLGYLLVDLLGALPPRTGSMAVPLSVPHRLFHPSTPSEADVHGPASETPTRYSPRRLER